MSKHPCHAVGCEQEIPPRLLMCPKHWYMVPKDAAQAIWAHYVPGQEVRKDPTPAYMVAQCRAVIAVAEKEGKECEFERSMLANFEKVVANG